MHKEKHKSASPEITMLRLDNISSNITLSRKQR